MTRSFSFGGHIFEVAGDAGLYWPDQRALLVADLHLEKASAFAVGGQMLPPYDSVATLHALETLAGHYPVETVFCLGDNFHDDAGEQRLGGQAAALLRGLVARTNWVWITGNHDRGLTGRWGGQSAIEVEVGGIVLRHEAEKDCTHPEISGHFHPKFRQQVRGRMVSRRCFVRSERKLIMPAFGALTGGLDAGHVAIMTACDLGPDERAEALVPMRNAMACFDLSALSALAK
ncbi:MAG: ligase-associated DNA damage response endonuclease PdeM [Sphingomonadaceae bacterium]|nr:ligase-associated DNA damage response endonuclease PdeM [Sphingomonadaceae bacterium]